MHCHGSQMQACHGNDKMETKGSYVIIFLAWVIAMTDIRVRVAKTLVPKGTALKSIHAHLDAPM